MTRSAEITREPTGWALRCEECGFTSSGWRTRALAEARREQHRDEHGGAPPADPPRNDPEE